MQPEYAANAFGNLGIKIDFSVGLDQATTLFAFLIFDAQVQVPTKESVWL